jgi:DNA processing protein
MSGADFNDGRDADEGVPSRPSDSQGGRTETDLDLESAEFRATLRLALVSGVGPRLSRALLERFGSAEAIFAAPSSQVCATPGIGPVLGQRLDEARTRIDVDAQIALARDHNIAIVTEADAAYPRLLREIHDPPSVLYVNGQLLPQDALAVGIVGTRHATHYGRNQAERLAAGLARAGLTIVSGLARGIDAAAHRGALAAGGRTLAVLASGVLNVYPPEHRALADQIAGQGAVISESPLQFQPIAGAFPQRNRIISGMSLGVIVVEAGTRSGALITARHAMEQGREVLAVPGHIDNHLARGCHRLIQDGARLIESADDVLEELGPLVEATPGPSGNTVRQPAELQLNELEQRVLQAIDADPTPIDQVVRTSGLPVNRVLSTISVLEMRHLVGRVAGNQVARR